MNISYEFASPNYDERPKDHSIDFIILHYTEMTFEGVIDRLCDPASKVSSHYLIKEDGKIFQLAHDEMRAWHAGKSFWQGREALNDCSIGIEIDNLGTTPFADLQMEACISLCKFLMNKYGIKPQNILGHSDIAPARKLDPGIYFDWQKLAKNGLGIFSENDSLWEDCAERSENHSDNFSLNHYKIELIQSRLKSIGYKLEITGYWDEQTNLVARAFQAHFYPKFLQMKGIEFYRNMNSAYFWNNELDKVLNSLFK